MRSRGLVVVMTFLALTGCSPGAPAQSAAKPAASAAAQRTAVPTLDPATEASAQWKTLVGVATVAAIFDAPLALGVDSHGTLYVADASQNRLVVVDASSG